MKDISEFKPLLAQNFDNKNNHIGWFMSEKLDGIRCIFYNNHLYSRTAHTIHAPTWFIENISKSLEGTGVTMLDGELYTKRNDFQCICSIVKKDIPIDEEWKDIKYMVFDIPLENDLVFRDRYNKMMSILNNNNLRVQIVIHNIISDISDIDKYLDEITNVDGEGIMLRDPNSYYEQKRSKSLIKYKKFSDDDAIITAVELGKGKYVKDIGKFKVKWLNEPHIEFYVGTGLDDNIRKIKDKESLIGKVVKIKYYSVTGSGKPRFPVFIGFRE